MIYKVLYQKDQIVNPRRETTKTLFLEADNVVAASNLGFETIEVKDSSKVIDLIKEKISEV